MSENKRKEMRENLQLWQGLMGIGVFLFFVGLIAFALAQMAELIVVAGIALAVVSLVGPNIGEALRAGTKIVQGVSVHEKVDKMATAIGLKWQEIPRRRRWVTKDTPDPAEEPEQPQVLTLEAQRD